MNTDPILTINPSKMVYSTMEIAITNPIITRPVVRESVASENMETTLRQTNVDQKIDFA